MRYALTVVVIAAGYYAFTEGGKALLLTGPAGAFWPSAGLGIAVLYLGGLRWWPALLLGDLGSLVKDVIELSVPPGTALAEAAGDMARTIVAVLILLRLAGPRIALDRLHQVGAVLVAVAAGATISATVAMLALWAGGAIEASGLDVFWRSWWLGDLSGGLVVLPLALAWAPPLGLDLRRRGAWEGALVLAAVVGLSVLALSGSEPLTYLVFPALIWAALRFGPQGGTSAVAVATAIAVWSASNELGPFVEHSATDSALNLQLYITLAALTTLCLAAVVSERGRATRALAESRDRLAVAGDAERRRVERDLHDGAQQRLVEVRIRLRFAEELIERDPASVHDAMSELDAELQACIEDIRSLAAGIYPSVLADFGLAAALRSLARRSPIQVRVESEDTGRCRPEVEAAVYFCCSEAVQNAVKHGATAVVISLEHDRDLRFAVHDDGPGFLPAQARSGHGIANMRDRIDAVHGTVDVRSTPGRGTSVVGTVTRP